MARADEDLERAAKEFEDFDPEAATQVDVSDLRELAAAAAAVREGEAELTKRVAISRARGRSWTRIGDTIGVSRQAARQRFSDKIGDGEQAG